MWCWPLPRVMPTTRTPRPRQNLPGVVCHPHRYLQREGLQRRSVLNPKKPRPQYQWYYPFPWVAGRVKNPWTFRVASCRRPLKPSSQRLMIPSNCLVRVPLSTPLPRLWAHLPLQLLLHRWKVWLPLLQAGQAALRHRRPCRYRVVRVALRHHPPPFPHRVVWEALRRRPCHLPPWIVHPCHWVPRPKARST